LLQQGQQQRPHSIASSIFAPLSVSTAPPPPTGRGARGLQASASTAQVVGRDGGNRDGGDAWQDGKQPRAGNGNGSSSSGHGNAENDYTRNGDRSGGGRASSQRPSFAASGRPDEELRGGARVSYILDSLFGSTLRGVDPFDTTTDDDICVAISNASGHQPSLFVPEQCFHALVKRQIARLQRPALEAVDAVKLEMAAMAVREARTQP
jgi:hypothetical protein